MIVQLTGLAVDCRIGELAVQELRVEERTLDTQGIILQARNLRTYFHTPDGIVRAVDGVDLDVRRGEVLGLVGESGCGKSVTALSIMRLVEAPGRIESGEVWFEGRNLLALDEAEMARVRGSQIAMIFQEPISRLTPVFRVGEQVAEVLKVHRRLGGKQAWEQALALLETVGISEPEKYAFSYPHELSGGMAQRVMIAMALACTPQLVIADEPTTALDVTIQMQILDLMRGLHSRVGVSVLLITHDLGVIWEVAERVAVMYAGRIVEQADVGSIFEGPLHPYTQGLLASIPQLGEARERLDAIEGAVPDLGNLPPGCKFAPRCQARIEHGLTRCLKEEPELAATKPGQLVRCWLYH
jgi:oligopeptide/dipeptide ABC transporter ATP-binding protein